MKRNFVNKNRKVDLRGVRDSLPRISVVGGLDYGVLNYFDYEFFIDTRKDSVYNLFEKSKKI